MTATPHVHHWQLDPPHDGQVLGVCGTCGARATWPGEGLGGKIIHGAADLTWRLPRKITEEDQL